MVEQLKDVVESRDSCVFFLIKGKRWGIWVAQLVTLLTLDFGSGHNLRVLGLSSVSGSVLSGESA